MRNKRLKANISEKTRKFQSLSMIRLVPNLATVMAMSLGLTAIRFAIAGRFTMALASIFIAGILDAMDGRLARAMGVASDFGAELDSLSDFISFGVAPAIIMYIHALQSWKGLGWVFCLFFAVSMGLRLARFNISSRGPERPLGSGRFFIGVPAPAGAMICLFPLTLALALDQKESFHPFFTIFSMVVSAGLMVSKIPTFSLKSLSIPRVILLPFFLFFGVLGVFLCHLPWETLSVMTVIYILSIPFSYASFLKISKKTPLNPDEIEEIPPKPQTPEHPKT